jgi:hypothetical protein
MTERPLDCVATAGPIGKIDMERKYDKQFRVVFDALRERMEPPTPLSKKSIGFVRERE